MTRYGPKNSPLQRMVEAVEQAAYERAIRDVVKLLRERGDYNPHQAAEFVEREFVREDNPT